MDSFEGFQAEPLSLHKYLYANANPVMGLDPSGQWTLSEQLNVSGVVGLLAETVVNFYNPLAMTHRATDAIRKQAYILSLVLRYNAGMKIALSEILSGIGSASFGGGRLGSLALKLAIDRMLVGLDEIYLAFIRRTPRAVGKAVIFGPFGKLITYYGVTTGFIDYMSETTRLISSVVKASIGVSIAINFREPQKSGLLLATAAIGQFYPELLLYYAQKSVEGRIEGNNNRQAY